MPKGNWGHAGRPGIRGGSAPGDGGDEGEGRSEKELSGFAKEEAKDVQTRGGSRENSSESHIGDLHTDIEATKQEPPSPERDKRISQMEGELKDTQKVMGMRDKILGGSSKMADEKGQGGINSSDAMKMIDRQMPIPKGMKSEPLDNLSRADREAKVSTFAERDVAKMQPSSPSTGVFAHKGQNPAPKVGASPTVSSGEKALDSAMNKISRSNERASGLQADRKNRVSSSEKVTLKHGGLDGAERAASWAQGYAGDSKESYADKLDQAMSHVDNVSKELKETGQMDDKTDKKLTKIYQKLERRSMRLSGQKA